MAASSRGEDGLSAMSDLHVIYLASAPRLLLVTMKDHILFVLRSETP